MSTNKSEQKRKPLTRAQRIAKNLRDRERRAEKKEAARAAGIPEKQSVVKEKRAMRARAVAAKIIENPALSVAEAARAVGLPESVATHPATITNTPEWSELLDEYLPQGEVLETHRGLLRASRVDHMIFADGPKNEAECAAFIAGRNAKLKPEENPYTRDDVLTDDDIRAMLDEKNCTVRRISRTEQSRHVYFFSPDNRARKDALEMVYKLRGSYAADKAAVAFSLAALAAARDASRTLPPASSAPQLPRAVDSE